MQGVVHHAIDRSPEEVIMDTAEAIIAVYRDRLNYFTLTICSNKRLALNDHVKTELLFHTDKLVVT